VGYHLEVTDLYTPLKEHTSDVLSDKLAKAWEKECETYQSIEAGREERITEEDQAAQFDESSYEMFWPQDYTVWDLCDLCRDRDQVALHFLSINFQGQ